MIIAFELSMPNVGSWNGRWSGESKRYIIRKTIRSQDDIKKAQSLIGYHYYNFGDGWGANVCVEQINAKEANKRRKISKGFCGYEWMINSIMEFNKILNTE